MVRAGGGRWWWKLVMVIGAADGSRNSKLVGNERRVHRGRRVMDVELKRNKNSHCFRQIFRYTKQSFFIVEGFSPYGPLAKLDNPV